MGKVNIVRGTSSSGKSSLLRGIHAAIVGQTPHEDKYIREVETLHLADGKDRRFYTVALVRGRHRLYGGNESSISISPSKISSKNGTPKALFTTMLSNLPPTKLHQAIMNLKQDRQMILLGLLMS